MSRQVLTNFVRFGNFLSESRNCVVVVTQFSTSSPQPPSHPSFAPLYLGIQPPRLQKGARKRQKIASSPTRTLTHWGGRDDTVYEYLWHGQTATRTSKPASTRLLPSNRSNWSALEQRTQQPDRSAVAGGLLAVAPARQGPEPPARRSRRRRGRQGALCRQHCV